jgi:CheY-like chemotaxis protein
LSPRDELAARLHRLRSTLARLKAELELSEADGTSLPIDRLLGDLDEAFAHLSAIETMTQAPDRVLVVDDDERLAEITARGLRRVGFDAEASNVLRPLAAREVLVFDLGLFGGLDANDRKSVRAARPIVVTGATDPASRAVATSLEASGFLVKPIELDELAAAIKRRLEEA